MKQFIRENVFETNSSSMHSLVISKKAKPYTEYDKKLEYWGNDFELFNGYDECCYERFPFRILDTPIEKLRYYVAHYVGYKKQMDKLDLVKEFVSKYLNIPYDKIKLSFEVDKWNSDETEESYGWVGINDTGEDVFEYIEKNNIPLEEFILDPRYTFIVDGDEYQEFKKLFSKGLIDLDNIEYISSGKSFWLDDVKVFSIYYINRLVEDAEYNELIEYLSDYNNEYIKYIEIEDDYDVNINQESLKCFASGLEYFRTLEYGKNMLIKLNLKSHTEKDYELIVKYVDEIIKT